MIALGATTARLPAIKELLGEVQCALLREIEQNIDPLEDVARLIGSAIDPDSDIPLKEGGVIREGYDKQLDEARHLSKDIRGILAEIEEREKDATGHPGRCASGITGCSAITLKYPIPSRIRCRRTISASRP